MFTSIDFLKAKIKVENRKAWTNNRNENENQPIINTFYWFVFHKKFLVVLVNFKPRRKKNHNLRGWCWIVFCFLEDDVVIVVIEETNKRTNICDAEIKQPKQIEIKKKYWIH